jgi:hypothetical protein
LGQLSVTSKLTDSQGQAQVSISSDTGNIGAANIKAEYQELSIITNFEFLATEVGVISQPSISISMINNGLPLNRFKADETVQLQAILLDAVGAAIENQIVIFSTGKGILNISETLTNDLGLAQAH